MSAKHFGIQLTRALSEHTMTEADLVRAMHRSGNAITRQYVNLLIHSKRTPPPELVEKLSDAIKIPRDDRTILHRAAALDNGYRIGILRG